MLSNLNIWLNLAENLQPGRYSNDLLQKKFYIQGDIVGAGIQNIFTSCGLLAIQNKRRDLQKEL